MEVQMADIKVIKYEGRFKEEHDPTADSLHMLSFKTATKELTDAKLANLIDGADAADEHIHDGRYFAKDEYIDASTGSADAGLPVITDADGLIDLSFFDLEDLANNLSHSDLADLENDDHTQYILVDGTRAFTGNQDMGGFLLTGLGAPTNDNDAARKAYVDAVATGLRPMGNVQLATDAPLPEDVAVVYNNGTSGVGATLTGDQNGALEIDGVEVELGWRVLIKDQVDKTQNGIYIVTAVGDVSNPFVLTRSADQDNSPLKEVINGVFIPKVLQGDANADKPFVIVSVGTGTAGPSGKTPHVLGTDDIEWDVFTSPTQLQAGDGINFDGNTVEVDLLANGGLKIVSGELAVEPNDFAGDGLVDDGNDNLAIDWATDFTIDAADDKAFKASDLASTANGEGASIVGVEDALDNFTSDNVEGVLAELYLLAKAGGVVEYTAGAGGVSKGDLVYISANNTVLPYADLEDDFNVVGIAKNDAAATELVEVVKFDSVITGVLTGATAGVEYYWDGSEFSTTPSNVAGEHVYLAGVAKNATDLTVEMRHLYKNS
jgi:hypothetical protein